MTKLNEGRFVFIGQQVVDVVFPPDFPGLQPEIKLLKDEIDRIKAGAEAQIAPLRARIEALKVTPAPTASPAP